MSKRNKRQEIDDLEAPESEASDASAEQEVAKIPFPHWFDKMLKAGKVRDYQDEALLVFFRKQGLKNIEIEDTYNRAFKNF